VKVLVRLITLSNQTEEYVKMFVIWVILVIQRQVIALLTALQIIIKMTTIAYVKHYARIQNMRKKYQDNVLLIAQANHI
jgi:hypothetical protein